ncbi:DUF1847 domain-containing protein [Feifania hominis]|uniref:DUF1847 domain-containing protein n=1 Tax=Feifania hominis TaxID=2763660 RepID=A0A926DDR4_9FIRM|nr:DUF1847 domain-containing protein [Feifania hominis]MBC8535977.1 DUF1847 domain-containing protein [Feifania hominis]
MYTCASCTVHACRTGERDKLPKNCPIRNGELMETAFEQYGTEENHRFYVESSKIESAGYGQWPRIREIIEFARNMGYEKLGVAFCSGLAEEGRIACDILRRHGFTVVSVICKSGSIPKERAGLQDSEKVRPGRFEPMCNPIAQAMLLNEQKTQFNIVIGLCVGHDSLFYRYADAPVTTLVTKDRVLAHNPAGALYCANSYFKSKL